MREPTTDEMIAGITKGFVEHLTSAGFTDSPSGTGIARAIEKGIARAFTDYNLVTRVLSECGSLPQADGKPVRLPNVRVKKSGSFEAKAFLAMAQGDRDEAFYLLRQDLTRRYPGFKASPGSPGWKEFDRIRHAIYKLCRERTN